MYNFYTILTHCMNWIIKKSIFARNEIIYKMALYVISHHNDKIYQKS